MVHPNSLKNLKKPWEKGETGNAGGRPKESLYPTEAMRMLSDKCERELIEIAEDESQNAVLRAVAKQYLRALTDHPLLVNESGKSIDRIADRLEGKPLQKQKIEGQITDNRPVVLDRERFAKSTQSDN